MVGIYKVEVNEAGLLIGYKTVRKWRKAMLE